MEGPRKTMKICPASKIFRILTTRLLRAVEFTSLVIDISKLKNSKTEWDTLIVRSFAFSIWQHCFLCSLEFKRKWHENKNIFCRCRYSLWCMFTLRSQVTIFVQSSLVIAWRTHWRPTADFRNVWRLSGGYKVLFAWQAQSHKSILHSA